MLDHFFKFLHSDIFLFIKNSFKITSFRFCSVSTFILCPATTTMTWNVVIQEKYILFCSWHQCQPSRTKIYNSKHLYNQRQLVLSLQLPEGSRCGFLCFEWCLSLPFYINTAHLQLYILNCNMNRHVALISYRSSRNIWVIACEKHLRFWASNP